MASERAGAGARVGVDGSELMSWSSFSAFTRLVKEMGLLGTIRSTAPPDLSPLTRVEMASGTAAGLVGTQEPLNSRLFMDNLSCN